MSNKNVVSQEYFQNTVTKLNDEIEALTLDNRFLDESMQSALNQKAIAQVELEDKESELKFATKRLMQEQMKSDFYKREYIKMLERYEALVRGLTAK